MKQSILLAAVLVCCSAVSICTFAQEAMDPKDKALLEQLSRDVTVMPATNAIKLKLYTAFINKSPSVIRAKKSERAGREGQRLITYFIVDHGKVKIVSAYIGDPSGSPTLNYVRTYTTDKLKLGYRDKDWNFVPLSGDAILKDKVLVIGYSIAGERGLRIF